MSEKKIDLIAQMLAKAERTTPEEAEALTQAAARLMQKYMIDQAVIDARRAQDGKSHEKIIEVAIPFGGTYRDAFVDMGASIVWALKGMRTLESKRGTKSVLWIVGFEGDVKQAEVLVRSLQIQATVAMKQWWQENAPAYRFASDWDRRKARDHFIRGFGHGAAGRIMENRLTVMEEAGSGAALVLVDRSKKVDQFVDDMNLRKGRASNTTWDDHARRGGNQAGRNASTGEKDLTQGRGIEAARA